MKWFKLGILSTSLLLACAPVLAATHTVNQTGLAFEPALVEIDQGDTVEWIWSSGFHTVTSGEGPSDPEAGALFDASFSSGTFSHVFTEAGTVPYFCRPHFSLGMTGVVVVNQIVAAEGSTLGGIKALYR